MRKAGRATLAAIMVLAGVSGFPGGCGEVADPFAAKEPWAPTPVPADFAIVVDTTADTYYARQRTHQEVTASDLMSRTTFTTLRDVDNGVADQYSGDRPLSAAQMQAMWNEVTKHNLMEGGKIWYYWKTGPDAYRTSERRMQIRANGKVVEFSLLNHWGLKLRDLAFLCENVRFAGPGATSQPVAAVPAGTQAVEFPASRGSDDRAGATSAPATRP